MWNALQCLEHGWLAVCMFNISLLVSFSIHCCIIALRGLNVLQHFVEHALQHGSECFATFFEHALQHGSECFATFFEHALQHGSECFATFVEHALQHWPECFATFVENVLQLCCICLQHVVNMI